MQDTKLQPPGAGLPKVEHFFLRIFFRLFLLGHNGRKLRDKMQSERNLTVNLIKSFPPEKLQTQVLIPRIMGSEDSSRNWSAAMTLQHLVITTNGMIDIAESLVKGIKPTRVVKIEDVKPDAALADTFLPTYEAAVERLLAFAQGHPTLSTKVTHLHPWFGELDGHGWIGLATTHLGIHRRQIGLIKALLP